MCVCVRSGPYTHGHVHKMLCYFKSVSFLHPSAAPSSSTVQSWGPLGVFSGVAGADGGGARARVPAVADTGSRETDEDGHRALCSGGSRQLPEAGLSVAAVAARPGGYTAVHTVLTVNSASVAMMSVGWMLRSYIGFSNVARTFVFSWPA